MMSLSVFTKGRLIVVVVFTLLSGALVVSGTKWAVDVAFPQSRTVTAEQFAPHIGNLVLSATVVAEDEVVLNAAFLGKAYVTQPGYDWAVWFSSTIVGFEAKLPEGLMLVAGALKANGTCPLPNHVLGVQAKVRGVMDGEWVVYARFSAMRGMGDYYGLAVGGIRIFVSDGRIVHVEKSST